MSFYESSDEFVVVDNNVVTLKLKLDLEIIQEVRETEDALSDDEGGQEIDEEVPSGIKDAIRLWLHLYDSQITDTMIFKFISHIEDENKNYFSQKTNKRRCNIFFSKSMNIMILCRNKFIFTLEKHSKCIFNLFSNLLRNLYQHSFKLFRCA